MNILIVSHGIPSKDDPQWGCFEFDQAQALKSLGHKVIVAAVDGRYRRIKRKRGITHRVIDGIDTYLVYWFPLKILSFFKMLQLWVRPQMALMIFDRIVRDEGIPDIIYAHYLFGMKDMSKVHIKYPMIPIVGIEHWSKMNQDSISKDLYSHGVIAYNTVDRLLAVSNSLKDRIKKHFNKDADVVYDMLGQEFINSCMNKKNIGSTFRFIAVGSLYQIKRYDMLIRAFAQSGLSNENCGVVIIGDGEEKRSLHLLIRELGLEEKVLLVGRKNKQEIINYLRECHVFVVSSSSETFGVACVEALSQGLPAIATRCGGPEEFISEKNGIMVPTDDSDALADAMRYMFCNYERFDSEAISEDCRKRFAPNVIAERLDQIFEEEIQKKQLS